MDKLNLSENEKEFLLKLARQSIEHYLETGKYLNPDLKKLFSEKFFEKRATFVTLTENNQLRGCIGHVEIYHPLYLDIIENAVHSAFFDPRFYPLSEKEIEKIKIEISILTPLQKLSFNFPKEILKKLTPLKHGVLIRKNKNSATYLPQVWREIKNKKEFLSNLCLKAGLGFNCWQDKDLEIYTYEVESFKEK